MRYWISWHQPTDDTRPLTYPPNKSILGWWESGSDANGVATLCAVVSADNEALAQADVLKDWPEAERWRFCEPKGDDHVPGDRFPLSEWMNKRLN